MNSVTTLMGLFTALACVIIIQTALLIRYVGAKIEEATFVEPEPVITTTFSERCEREHDAFRRGWHFSRAIEYNFDNAEHKMD